MKKQIYYTVVQGSGLLNIRAYLNQSTGERHLIIGNDRLTESVIVDGRIPRFDDFGVILESLQLATYRKSKLLRKSKQGNFFCLDLFYSMHFNLYSSEFKLLMIILYLYVSTKELNSFLNDQEIEFHHGNARNETEDITHSRVIEHSLVIEFKLDVFQLNFAKVSLKTND